jgi:hypothetical protein
MSDDVQFDNHVKEQLGNYSPDVPPHIWDNIVAKRGRKKPGGFWLSFFNRKNLLIAAVLLAGGAAYWLLPASSKKSTTASTERNNISNNTEKIAGNNNTATDPATAYNNSNSKNDITKTDNPSTLNNDNKLINPAENNTNAQLGNSGNGPVKAAGNNQAGDAKSNGSIYSPLQFSPSANNRFIKRKQAQHHLPIRLPAAEGSSAYVQEDGNNQADESKPLSPAQGGTVLGKLLFTAEKNIAAKPTAGKLLGRQLSSLYLPDCPSVEDNAAGNKRYFDVYAGPDLGMRSFSGFTSDTGSANYLQKRKETAKFSSAFSAGIRYTRVFNNGMSLRTGVNYSQINEKFKYINQNDIRYILVITPRQVIINGTPTTVFDTLRYTETGTRIRTTYNRYRSVDIPLQLGYEFGNGRLHTNISAGAIINVYSWQKGDVLDSAYQPISITTGKGSSTYGFKTNIGVGFLASASLYYKLNNRLHLLAEPYIRYNLKPMSRDNQSFTQKYNTVGLRLGVRWDLR